MTMSLEQIKRAVALLDEQQQAELISYTLQLRYAHDAVYHREVADRLNDRNPSHWLTPDEFERRLDAL
jgi:asparagine synthetase B (glutamine-hydrolysing)